MIQRVLGLLIILFGLMACSDDEPGFGLSLESGNIRGLKPVPGGAMLYYSLPENEDVFSINVRYTDSFGIPTLKSGGYGSDSLLLDGFNEPRTGVRAQVTLVNRQSEESAPIDITFDTEASAAYAFFDQVEVQPYWDGFQVVYKAPDVVAGMVHVFYEGTNPMTQQPDTIFVQSFPIIKGGDTLLFSLQQEREMNTVILRTQDARGLRVGQKVWKDVESYVVQQLNYNNGEFDFIDVNNKSVKNDGAKTDVKYLFDGDTKGTQRMAGRVYYELYTFLAGPGAFGAPFIVDLKEEKIPASLRIYGILNSSLSFPSTPYFPTGEPKPLAGVWESRYYNKLPCEVVVYGGNSMDGEWIQLAEFSETPTAVERWSAACDANLAEQRLTSLEELEAADPCYMEISFPATPQRYRYLKIVINDTFVPVLSDGYINTAGDQNPNEYVTMHELEVYVKKD